MTLSCRIELSDPAWAHRFAMKMVEFLPPSRADAIEVAEALRQIVDYLYPEAEVPSIRNYHQERRGNLVVISGDIGDLGPDIGGAPRR